MCVSYQLMLRKRYFLESNHKSTAQSCEIFALNLKGKQRVAHMPLDPHPPLFIVNVILSRNN